MSASARKAIGAVAILAFLVVYVVLAVMIGEQLHALPWAAMAFYAVAGVAWVFPLRPLFAWMHPKED
jgi:hypothetical protein